MASKKRKKKGGSHRKSHKRVEAGKKAARTRKRRKAERAAARKKSKRHGGKRSSKRRGVERRSSKRRSHKRRSAKRSHKRRGSKRRSRRGGKRRSSRRRRSRKSHAAETPRRRSRKRRSSRRRRGSHRRRSSGRRHSRRSRRNPASVGEYVTTGLTFGAGAILAEVADRFVATHALGASVSGATGTDGKPLFGDTPPTSGSYAGLFNGTAVVAPMNMARWGVALGMTVVPIGIATWAISGKSPKLRAAFVGLGLGAGVRTLLKGFSDLSGKLLGRTATGARLFDNEARAQAVQALAQGGADTTGNFPNSGLGKAMGCGSCANCKAGVGACCGNLSGQQPPQQAPSPAQAPPPQGTTVQPPAPPPPPAPPAPPAMTTAVPPARVANPGTPPPAATGIRGVPNGGRSNPWLWGETA